MANDPGLWSLEDFQAYRKVLWALRTPRDWKLDNSAGDQAYQIESAASKKDMEQYARDINQPCPWTRKLINRSESVVKPTRRWGFVILRDVRIVCSDES